MEENFVQICKFSVLLFLCHLINANFFPISLRQKSCSVFVCAFCITQYKDMTSFFPLPVIKILLYKPISKQTAIPKCIFLFGNIPISRDIYLYDIPISRDKQPDFRQCGWIILISSSILAVIVKYQQAKFELISVENSCNLLSGQSTYIE